MARLVTLFDVKAHLNITRTADDDELTGFLLDAIAAVEDLVGPITPRSYTEEFDVHSRNVVLSHLPVQSVQSVSIQPWLGATPTDDTLQWRLNSTTGVLRRAVVGGTLPWLGPGSIFTVTYIAGRADVPGPVNRAILNQVADMWKSQRGSQPMPAGGPSEMPMPYAGAAGFLSSTVMELLRPYMSPPGVA